MHEHAVGARRRSASRYGKPRAVMQACTATTAENTDGGPGLSAAGAVMNIGSAPAVVPQNHEGKDRTMSTDTERDDQEPAEHACSPAIEARYAAALVALDRTPDIAAVAAQHGLARRELRVRAAFADCVSFGLGHHLEFARAYDLDDHATDELVARLFDAGHDVPVPVEVELHAN
ncbi:MAG: hypothetical protein ABW252_01015 [Polyangiales bacterium]